jgi:hypothetical protein
MNIITQTVLLFTTLTGADLAQQINEHPVIQILEVTHPYGAVNVNKKVEYVLQLELYDSEPNEIYDEDEWFDDYGLPYPQPPVKPYETEVPLETKYGHLCFLRSTDEWIVAVYESKHTLTQPVGMHDTASTYTLVALEKAGARTTVFAVHDMSALFPSILRLCGLEVRADYVYFNAAYNDFAELTNDSTGYLYCLDISNSTMVWATKNLVSSYYGFMLYDDYILTGYGFTNEDDFLYVIDRFTGEIVQSIPITTAHEHIVVKGSFCFVRTYNTNYIFSVTQKRQN